MSQSNLFNEPRPVNRLETTAEAAPREMDLYELLCEARDAISAICSGGIIIYDGMGRTPEAYRAAKLRALDRAEHYLNLAREMVESGKEERPEPPERERE